MTRRWRAIVGLLAAQAALSGVVVVLEATRSCAACGSGRLFFGLAGLVYYTALLVLARTRGPSRLFYGGLLLAFGVHAALTAQMFLTGTVCGPCLGASFGALLLVGLSISLDRDNIGRLALVVPWSALLVALGSLPFRAAAPPDPIAGVSIVVFTEPDCPYCDELRNRIMPEMEREFGARIRVDYRPASDLPAVRRTPTLILTPGRVGARGRVIEGLPTVERLRGAIRDVETRS